jgi:drug/metabolite transporter (DMT)-like permease
MTVEKKTMWAHIAGILTAIIWGTTFISTKVLLDDFDPLAVLIYRFVIAYVALFLFKPKPVKFQGLKNEIWYFLAGLSGVTIYFLCENVGLTYTLASNASVIVSTAPMFTALLAFIFLKNEKPKPYFFIGFVVAMAGIVLISFNGKTTFELNPMGDLLALGAAIIWAVYSIIVKKHIDMSTNMIAITKRIIFYGVVTMLPVGAIYGVDVDWNLMMKPANLGNFIYLGIGASAICYITWNYSMEVLGAVKASLYIYVVPVITIIASVFILDEKFTVVVACGVALTIAGLMISEKNPKTKVENNLDENKKSA